MRKSSVFLCITASSLVFCTLLLGHALRLRGMEAEILSADRSLVKELRLTDLCLFTEARYTRHPAMADAHTPFQDHPMALDHFPSGSLVPPPPYLARQHD